MVAKHEQRGCEEQRGREGQRFPASARLRRNEDFRDIYRGRRSVADDTLVIYARHNGGTTTRLGVSVSRKVGNAVVRNRWKRLIREAFRQTRPDLPRGVDLVVIPRRGATPDAAKVSASLPVLARRAAKKLDR